MGKANRSAPAISCSPAAGSGIEILPLPDACGGCSIDGMMEFVQTRMGRVGVGASEELFAWSGQRIVEAAQAARLTEVFHGPGDVYPVQVLVRIAERVTWLLDEAAAELRLGELAGR